MRTVTVEPIDLGETAVTLETVRRLRSAMELSQRVTWTCAGRISGDLATLLEHLPPPSRGGGAHADDWRANHAYGALYERREAQARTTFERAIARGKHLAENVTKPVVGYIAGS